MYVYGMLVDLEAIGGFQLLYMYIAYLGQLVIGRYHEILGGGWVLSEDILFVLKDICHISGQF